MPGLLLVFFCWLWGALRRTAFATAAGGLERRCPSGTLPAAKRTRLRPAQLLARLERVAGIQPAIAGLPPSQNLLAPVGDRGRGVVPGPAHRSRVLTAATMRFAARAVPAG